MCAADRFLIYDRIQYTKKGWINRNRICRDGREELISLPLKKNSDYLDIAQRQLADTWPRDSVKLKNKVKASYSAAPFFDEAFDLFCRIVDFPDVNLHRFIVNSINEVCAHLALPVDIVDGPDSDDPDLKGVERVINLCQAYDADQYLNPVGGLDLYSDRDFSAAGVGLQFLEMNDLLYEQNHDGFIPSLSILDVMMFNEIEKVRQWALHDYLLLPPKM